MLRGPGLLPPTSTGGLARRPAQLRSWLSSWAWGQKTAADVVRDAKSALEDIGREVADPQLRRLARCSVNLGNAERVVESVLPDAGLCHPVHVEDSLIEWVLQPHRVDSICILGCLLEGFRSSGKLFWDRPACSEFRDVHTWLRGRSPADLKWHLPLMVFDDAGPFSATNSTFCTGLV